jgi:hypothetical protein
VEIGSLPIPTEPPVQKVLSGPALAIKLCSETINCLVETQDPFETVTVYVPAEINVFTVPTPPGGFDQE